MTEIEARLERIESMLAQLLEKQPAVDKTAMTTEQSCKHWNCHPNTLTAWKRQHGLIEGIHWWYTESGHKCFYNAELIDDGFKNGFDSIDHLRAVEKVRKSQVSQRK